MLTPPPWIATLLRIDTALHEAPAGYEVLLYLGRVHYEQLKRFLDRHPDLRDHLGPIGKIHLQLREGVDPIVVTVPEAAGGNRC